MELKPQLKDLESMDDIFAILNSKQYEANKSKLKPVLIQKKNHLVAASKPTKREEIAKADEVINLENEEEQTTTKDEINSMTYFPLKTQTIFNHKKRLPNLKTKTMTNFEAISGFENFNTKIERIDFLKRKVKRPSIRREHETKARAKTTSLEPNLKSRFEIQIPNREIEKNEEKNLNPDLKEDLPTLKVTTKAKKFQIRKLKKKGGLDAPLNLIPSNETLQRKVAYQRPALAENRLANSKHVLVKTINRYMSNPTMFMKNSSCFVDLVSLNTHFNDPGLIIRLFRSGSNSVGEEM